MACNKYFSQTGKAKMVEKYGSGRALGKKEYLVIVRDNFG